MPQLADNPTIDRKVAVKAFKLLEHYDLETINRVSSVREEHVGPC
jgi:hypothetical protein